MFITAKYFVVIFILKIFGRNIFTIGLTWLKVNCVSSLHVTAESQIKTGAHEIPAAVSKTVEMRDDLKCQVANNKF